MHPKLLACPSWAEAAEPWQCRHLLWTRREAWALDEHPEDGPGSLEADTTVLSVDWTVASSLPPLPMVGYVSAEMLTHIPGHDGKPSPGLCPPLLGCPPCPILPGFYLLRWDLVPLGNPCTGVLLSRALQGGGRGALKTWIEAFSEFPDVFCVCLDKNGGELHLCFFKGQNDPNAGVCSGLMAPLSECPRSNHVLLSPGESPEVVLGFVHRQSDWFIKRSLTCG